MYSFLRWILRQRYDVQSVGFESIISRGREGVLFLFEHPAFIDPLILYSVIGEPFQTPSPIVAEIQNRGMAKWAFRVARALVVPESSTTEPAVARREIESVLEESLRRLSEGRNLAISPAGMVKRKRLEDYRNKSMVARLIQKRTAKTRVVLVTIKGLWGSSFSYGETGRRGQGPLITGDLLWHALTGRIRKRPARLVFHEVEKHELERLKGLDVPAINQWLEAHMNREEQPNYYVPIRPSLAAAFLPEPQPEDQRHAQHVRELNRAMTMIAPEARSRFLACLHRLHPNSGRRVESVLSEPAQSDTPTLSQILNIDSVDAVELTTALQLEFSNQAKAPIFDGPVHEVLVTAAGLQIQDLAPGLSQTQPVDVRWFRPPPPQYSGQPADCLLEQFLRLAHGSPESAWIANGDGQMLTYREGLAMILVRASEISNFDKNSSLRLAMQSRVETAIDVLATLLVGREFVLGAADLPGAKPFDWSWGEGPSLGRARFQFLWPRVKWDKKRSPKAYRLEGEELFYAKIFEAGQRMLHDVQNEKKNGVLIHLKVESKSKAQSEVSLQEQWISLLAPLAVGLRAVYVDGAHTSDELTELARAFDVVAPRPRH